MSVIDQCTERVDEFKGVLTEQKKKGLKSRRFTNLDDSLI